MGNQAKKRRYKYALRKINLWIKNRKVTRLFIDKYRDGLIESLVKTYCIGKGIEIGIGETPYCQRSNTVYVDKYKNEKIKPDIVCDASKLDFPDNSFNFLLSSHCLEHCPNTIKVLNEWIRVIEPNGVLFLVLPHADRVVPDNEREKTPLKHHVDDYKNDINDNDGSHWEEIEKVSLKHKDMMNKNSVWASAGEPWDMGSLAKASRLHYHVWTQHEIIEILSHLNLKIIYAAEYAPERQDSFVVIARK